MADQADVAQGYCDLIASLFYPDGPDGATQPAVPVMVYPGWPDPATVAEDLVPAAGPLRFHVSVFAQPTERNTTRYPKASRRNAKPAATYGLAAAGQAITVSGVAPTTYSPQNLAVFVNGVAYVHTAGAGESPASIAAALCALVAADLPATTCAGAVITLPAGARIGALRVGVTGSTSREVRRQEKPFLITIWADTPANRTALAKRIDAALADLAFLVLADGTRVRSIYAAGTDQDNIQRQGLYTRHLTYRAEFPTTATTAAPEIVATVVNLDDADGNLIATQQA